MYALNYSRIFLSQDCNACRKSFEVVLIAEVFENKDECKTHKKLNFPFFDQQFYFSRTFQVEQKSIFFQFLIDRLMLLFEIGLKSESPIDLEIEVYNDVDHVGSKQRHFGSIMSILKNWWHFIRIECGILCPINSLHLKRQNWTWLLSRTSSDAFDECLVHQSDTIYLFQWADFVTGLFAIQQIGRFLQYFTDHIVILLK